MEVGFPSQNWTAPAIPPQIDKMATLVSCDTSWLQRVSKEVEDDSAILHVGINAGCVPDCIRIDACICSVANAWLWCSNVDVGSWD